MKLNRVVLTVVSCVCLAVATQASVTSIFDWQFESSAGLGGGSITPTTGGTTPPNSSPWTVASTTSPQLGDTATAAFSGSTITHVPETPLFPEFYGSAEGTYQVGGSPQLVLTLVSDYASPVDYSLTVIHFNTGGGFPTDGQLAFSVPGAVAGASTILESPAGGVWQRNTWTWTGVSFSGPQSLTITPGTPGNDLWFDEVQWSITGTVVPEPIYAQGLAIVGILVVGIGSSLRRKWQKRN